MRSFTVERNFHPVFVDNGYRYSADFKINFAGEVAYPTIILSLLWNTDVKLVSGTTRTETTVTGAAIVLLKDGTGWAAIADIPGYEPWVSFQGRVIRFRKQFTVELPIAPAISGVPLIGALAEKLGATRTMRIETEGSLDVISYLGGVKSTIL